MSTQAAAERRSAETQVRGLIDRFAAEHARLIGNVRRRLRKRLPAAHEIVYEYDGFVVISFAPNERGYDGVVALRAAADGVELWFQRGRELPDPEKLLRGSGKQTRMIPVDGPSMLARPAVLRLIEEAIALSPFPFDEAGRGSVVIRETAARRRGGAG